jgi:cytochrome oxidase assembly protein ShyY1
MVAPMTDAAKRARHIGGMCLITLVMLIVLVGLGVWQLQRKQEKQELIAALTAQLSAAPVPLPAKSVWGGLTARDEFRRVTFVARPVVGSDANVFASGSALRPDVSGLGVWHFTPVQTAAGETVVVNRGFIADGVPLPPQINREPATLTGYLRFPEKPGWFAAHEDVAKRLWFVRDHQAMAQALRWGEVAPFYVDLEVSVPPSSWPKPGALEVHLRDQHLQYAITWFGLAAVVAVAFGFWVVGARRGQ